MMNPERLQRIDEIFQSALDLAPEPRRDFLAQIRSDDPELHAEVDSLLGSYGRAAAFIETPAAHAAAALFAATPVATRIGTYTIEAPLGVGGMGEVYRAVDRMGRRVALKTLAPRLVSDPKHVSRFLQEARAVLALNHPNVVTVYDIGEADGVYYIASELIEGQTLRQAMSERAFTLDALLDIATQVATGVAAAHDKGIVHRDVKPENVMVRADGYVKVLDFGIAKLTAAFEQPNDATSHTALTREGLVIGTVTYMSPEQARGANVDARSDVWSLGVMLYEMVTGALPFPGDAPADVIGKILEREPLPLAHFVDSPPGELQAVVTRALAKDPSGRFQTMAELIAELKALRQDLAFAAKLERLNVPNRAVTESTGSKPFVFVCYAHTDADRVYPHIERLRRDGIDVWFDRGIRAGTVWRQAVGEAIDRATHVLFFVSPHSLRSEECDPEVQYALDKRKVIVPVFLERTELSPQLRVPLSRVHALYCDQMSAEALHDSLRDAILNRQPTLTIASTLGSKVGAERRRRAVLTATAATIAALAIAGLVWFGRTQNAPPLPTRSIAVLPFEAMSDDPKLHHLSEALVEGLTNSLTAEPSLSVKSRTSASNRPTGQSVSTFAGALGVSYVLEGSVRPDGDHVRVTAQLIRGRDDVHLLSRTFDIATDGADLGPATDQIAFLVFRYLRNDFEIAQARLQTTNDQAFGYYAKVMRLDPGGEDADTHQPGVDQKLIYLDKAIALDPNFAEPYYERAFAIDLGSGPGANEARQEVGRLLKRHLELRPDSVRGWTLLGAVQMDIDRDLAAAEASFRRAREVDPEYPWPVSKLGLLAERRGHLEEAADYLKQSTIIDHARPSHFFYGEVLFNLKRFDEAEQEFELHLRVFPSDGVAQFYRVATAYYRGDMAEYKRRFDALWAKYGATHPNYFVSLMLPAAEHEEELRDLMKRWDTGEMPVDAATRSAAYQALGEYDAAIDWLVRAMDEGKADSRFIRAGFVFDRLRAHPRFAEVLAKLDASEVTH